MQSQPPRRLTAAIIAVAVNKARFELAFDLLHPKSCLGLRCAPTFAAKSDPTKSLAPSDGQIAWECHPLPLTPSWMAKGYTRFNATASMRSQMRPRQPERVSVGATFDPRYGCAVNRLESASWLNRLHRAGFSCLVAITGGEIVTREQMT